MKKIKYFMDKIFLIIILSLFCFSYTHSTQYPDFNINQDSIPVIELTIDLSKIKIDLPNLSDVDLYFPNIFSYIIPDIKSSHKIIYKNLDPGYYRIIFILDNSDSLFNMINILNDTIISEMNFIDKNFETDEVIVTEELLPVELLLEKTVFNIPLFFPDPGVNAIDLLRKLPLIEVGATDVISIRGGTKVLILINGRRNPLSSSLKSLDADLIEKVEISTTPSAKYGEDARDGIVNIILKSDKEFEYNGNISGSLNTRERYSILGYMNFNMGKLSLSGNSSIGKWNTLIDGEYSVRYNTNETGGFTFIKNNTTGNSFNQNHNIGVSYDFNRLTYAGIDLSLFDFGSDETLREEISVSSFPETKTENFPKISKISSDSKTKSSSVYFNHSSKDKKEEISFNSFYSIDEFNSLTTSNSSPNSFGYRIGERYDWKMDNKVFLLNLDAMKNLNDKIIFDLGYNFKINDDKNTNIVDTLDSEGNFRFINSLSDVNTFYQTINSFYLTSKYLTKNFLYQVGGRFEFTSFDGSGKNVKFGNSYFNLLPVVFMSYVLDQGNQLNLKYSGYIERPFFYNLNPYLDEIDPLNQFQGNINLKPEYTHSLELKYNSVSGIGSWSPSVYFKYTDNAINNYSELRNNNVIYNSYKNEGKIYRYGMNIFYSGSIWKGIFFNSSFGISKTDVSSNIDFISSSEFYPRGNIYLSYSIPKIANVNLTYNYEGKKRSSQRVQNSSSNLTFGISRNFFNNSLRISLNTFDLLNTNKFELSNFGEFYTSNYLSNYNNRNVSFQLTYTFGEMKFDERKIKSTDQPEERFK